MEYQANTMSGGTKTFRSADGSVFRENGRELSAEEIDSVSWNDGAPSWEDYYETKQQLQKAATDRDAVLAYQLNVLDPAHTRLDRAYPVVTHTHYM